MYAKTFINRLTRCGWVCVDEGHGGNLIPHYFKFDHPSHTPEESAARYIEFTAANNKDGTPGRILEAWQGGKRARI